VREAKTKQLAIKTKREGRGAADYTFRQIKSRNKEDPLVFNKREREREGERERERERENVAENERQTQKRWD
jgi:hypothetical protein